MAIAIIAIIVALTVPAVQQARETSRRATCRNNLKQIGLALHAYHNVHNCLPLGVLGQQSADAYCWLVFLLPHLDQGPLYARINPDGRERVLKSYFDTTGTTLPDGATVIPGLRCPSSIMPTHSSNLGPGVLPEFAMGYAVVDYKACRGTDHADGLFYVPNNITTKKLGAMRWAMVRDGLSHTIAAGESSYPGRSGMFWSSWMDSPMDYSGVLFMAGGQMDLPAINCAGDSGGRFWVNAASDDCALSMHDGIVQMVFADGSVRSISQNIDIQLYQSLGSRADGRAISSDF